MGFYWTGYVIALVITITYIIIGFSYIFSVRANNLIKVGLNYSFFQLKVFEGEKPGFFKNTISILYQILINPLFSWITVFLSGYGLMKIVNEKLSTPEKVKEIQYKLGHNIYTKEEVIELLREIANFNGKGKEFENSLSYSGIIEEDNILNLDDEYGYGKEYELDKQNNKIYYSFHSPDYDTEGYFTYKYKIEGKDIILKVLEKKTKHFTEEYYDIKNGVVLESEITERYNNDKKKLGEAMVNIGGTLEEKINGLKKSIKWNKSDFFELNYFVLSKHTELFTKDELNQYFRSELENINLMITKINDICSKYNGSFKFNESTDLERYEVYGLEKLNKKDLEKVYGEIEKVAEEHGYGDKGFYWVKEKKDLLEKYLK